MTNVSGSGLGLGGGGMGDDAGAGTGGASGTDVGVDRASTGVVSDSPGSDASSGLGGDVEFDNTGGPPPDPVEGIATRAAREDTGPDDPDNPARVTGEDSSGVTPNFTP